MKRLFILTLIAFLLVSVKVPAKFVTFTDTPAFLNYARAAEQDIWTQMRENTGYVDLALLN